MHQRIHLAPICLHPCINKQQGNKVSGDQLLATKVATKAQEKAMGKE
jgi:hypothetical protein